MTGYLFQGQGRSFIMSAFSRIPKEPLIKSAMNRVAIKNEMIARRTTQVVAAHGHVTGAASRLREVRHRPPLPHLRYAIPGRGGYSTKPRSATPQAPIFDATLRDNGFAGGLRCQTSG